MKKSIVFSIIACLGLFAPTTVSLAAGASATTTNSAPTAVPPKSFKELPGGLKYYIIKAGTGAEAKSGQNVTVHYTGWLQSNNKKFDSSVDHGQPFSFPLGGGRVIKGWDEGVKGMKIGEKRQLLIPADMGYGATGTPGGPIPPNATLIFDVELLSVGK